MAIRNYRKAIARDAEFFQAYNNLGNALQDTGKVQEAIDCYHQCLSLQPDHPQVLSNMGSIYMEQNMMSAATQCFKASLSVTTNLSAPFKNLALLYVQQGNYAQAILCYNEVLRIEPMETDELTKRDNSPIEIGRIDEAMLDYMRDIAISPTMAREFLALAYMMSDNVEASQDYMRDTAFSPTMAKVHVFLALAYMISDNVEAAIKKYRQALMLCPDFPSATCNLFHALQYVCDWVNREEMLIEVEGIVRRQIEMSIIPSIHPFHATVYLLDPMLALDISRKHAQHCSLTAAGYSLSPFTHPPPLPIKGRGRNGRLRVGCSVML